MATEKTSGTGVTARDIRADVSDSNTRVGGVDITNMDTKAARQEVK